VVIFAPLSGKLAVRRDNRSIFPTVTPFSIRSFAKQLLISLIEIREAPDGLSPRRYPEMTSSLQSQALIDKETDLNGTGRGKRSSHVNP
jgi:hypothetical protein